VGEFWRIRCLRRNHRWRHGACLVERYRSRKNRSTAQGRVKRFGVVYPQAFSAENVAISSMKRHACVNPWRGKLKVGFQMPLHVYGIRIRFEGLETVPCIPDDR
jgi:hypothetical protein